MYHKIAYTYHNGEYRASLPNSESFAVGATPQAARKSLLQGIKRSGPMPRQTRRMSRTYSIVFGSVRKDLPGHRENLRKSL